MPILWGDHLSGELHALKRGRGFIETNLLCTLSPSQYQTEVHSLRKDYVCPYMDSAKIGVLLPYISRSHFDGSAPQVNPKDPHFVRQNGEMGRRISPIQLGILAPNDNQGTNYSQLYS